MSAPVYVLRTCSADLTSYCGFRWPESGPVACDDWDAAPRCGNGLHGLLWGEGEGDLLSWSTDARWLVVEVDAGSVVDLDGKVKFPRGTVVHCGDRQSATADIIARGASCSVVGALITAGDRGTATAGYRGTATAGDGGTATAGDRGTATAGYRGTATAGDGGTVVLRRWNGRWKLVVGYVGEDGIEPNVAYRLDGDGALVRARAQVTA